MSRTRQDDNGETVQSVTRALLILEVMAREGMAVTLSDLAHMVGLKVCTVHRLLTTLMIRGFVEQDSETLRYRLGIKAFEVGNAALFINDLRSVVRPFLRQLLEQINETINLAVLEDTEVVYIDQLESTNYVIVKMFARVGSKGPAYCTGTGKVLLADLSDQELRRRFSGAQFIRFTENTITNLEDLMGAMNVIRRDGYALDFSERDPEVTCVAVPIRNFEGKVQAAISASAPKQRMDMERITREILPALLDTAYQVSERLGYQKPVQQRPTSSMR